jgi:hypothetical protein
VKGISTPAKSALGELKPPRITYRLIGEALRTHHGNREGFSSLEATIRDHFDIFLDYLSHFERFIQAGLVKPNDIRPYLSIGQMLLLETTRSILQCWRISGDSLTGTATAKHDDSSAGFTPKWQVNFRRP